MAIESGYYRQSVLRKSCIDGEIKKVSLLGQTELIHYRPCESLLAIHFNSDNVITLN